MMNDNNGGGGGYRPLTKRQQVRFLVALTILSWATQTLLKQWGYGATLASSGADAPRTADDDATEKFVPPAGHLDFSNIATLEVRGDATIIGGEVKLRQVCRWADADKALFEPIGDLVIARFTPGAQRKALSIPEIRGTLRDAGINVGAINFSGPVNCSIARSDIESDGKTGIDQWIDSSKQTTQTDGASGADPQSALKSATAPAATATTTSAAADDATPVKSLRTALIENLAAHLNLSTDVLQVDFKPTDENVLNVSEPLFRWQIDPLRTKALGAVMWNVTLYTGNSNSSGKSGARKLTVAATARAWQQQVVLSRPLSAKQIIRDEDVVERRALVDDLPDDVLLTRQQIVGQQSSRELQPGTILTSHLIDPVQLVRPGQFVTITLEEGSVRLRTVAKALEPGAYGQTIRVKNEATREVFQVVLTGPQTASMGTASPAVAASN